MEAPLSSLILIQSGQRPVKFTSNRSSRGKFLPDFSSNSPSPVLNHSSLDLPISSKSLENILLTIPEVNILPCGVSALLELKEIPHSSKAYVLFIIDIDETNSTFNVCQKNHQHNCLRGPALLSHISSSFHSSGIHNIVPLVISDFWSPQKIKESKRNGAINYLTKPLSPKAARFLWLNIFRFQSLKTLSMPKRLPSFNLAPLELFSIPSVSSDSHLEGVIVDYYTPESASDPIIDFSKFINSPIKIQNLLRRIRRKQFNPYQLPESELLTCCKLIFEDSFRLLGLPIIIGQLEKFILVVKEAYLENDYHNFCHAVDVLQAIYLFLSAMGLKHFNNPSVECSIHRLSSKHIVTLLVAALGHDVGHPGVNNAFLIKTGIPMASMYNNVAVLEKFHALSLINLIHKHDCVFFPDLFNDHSEFHVLLSNIIIATDMAAHFDHLSNIKSLRENSNLYHDISDSSSLTILSALIKCSDLINVTRPFDIAKTWTQCLTDELYKQCSMEISMGIEPLVPIDSLCGPQNKSQVSFIQSMALPLFESVSLLLPELHSFPTQLNTNLSIWQQLDRPALASNLLEPTSSPMEKKASSSLSPRQSRMTLVAGI